MIFARRRSCSRDEAEKLMFRHTIPYFISKIMDNQHSFFFATGKKERRVIFRNITGSFFKSIENPANKWPGWYRP